MGRDPKWGMANDSESEIDPRDAGTQCQRCKRRYRVDLWLPEKLWGEVSKGANLLCPRCIADRLEMLGEFSAFELVRTA